MAQCPALVHLDLCDKDVGPDGVDESSGIEHRSYSGCIKVSENTCRIKVYNKQQNIKHIHFLKLIKKTE